jgi:hypothetical protein
MIAAEMVFDMVFIVVNMDIVLTGFRPVGFMQFATGVMVCLINCGRFNLSPWPDVLNEAN